MRTVPRWLLAILAILAILLVAGCGSQPQRSTRSSHGPVTAAVQNSIPLSQKGAAGGVATLNGSKHVTQAQLAASGTTGECLKKGTSELEYGACGSGSGKTQTEIEAFSATRNLSNINTAAEARTNLGLGTIATHPATEFGTTTELALKAPLASPTFTGVPAAPTAVEATSTTQLATTAFVHTVAATAQTAAEAAAIIKSAITGTKAAGKCLAVNSGNTGFEYVACGAGGGLTEAEVETVIAHAGKIGTTQLAALAVTEAKLAAGAVTASKLGTGAVETAALASEAVTLGKIKAATPAAGKVLTVKSGGTEMEWATPAGLPEWLTGLEAKSSSGGKVKLNLEKGHVFTVTITENTAIELEKVPAGNEGDEALIFFKENATGGFTVTFPQIGEKWVGSKPTFPTGANEETLVTAIVRGEAGKSAPTAVYGVGGAEGKEGPKGTTGTTGATGTVEPFIVPEKFAINGTVASSEKYAGFLIPTFASGEHWKLKSVQYMTLVEGTDKFKVFHYTKAEGPPGKEVEWAGALKELKAETTLHKTAVAATTEPATEEYFYVESVTAATTPKGMVVDLEMEHIG